MDKQLLRNLIIKELYRLGNVSDIPETKIQKAIDLMIERSNGDMNTCYKISKDCLIEALLSNSSKEEYETKFKKK